jgi:hypothetical protein
LNPNADQPFKYVATWLIDEWSKIGLHVTQRMVPNGPLVRRNAIVNSNRPGELIYDPVLGSGTRLIAAEMTGRICCGKMGRLSQASRGCRRQSPHPLRRGIATGMSELHLPLLYSRKLWEFAYLFQALYEQDKLTPANGVSVSVVAKNP